MCALRAYINKIHFWKSLMGIEKDVKTFSIPNNFFQNWFTIVCPKGTH